MALLPSRGTLARAFFALLVVAVPFVGSGGCNGRTACLQYSPGEYAANGNVCLSPSQALGSFTDPSCPGPITSVDGDGSYDGELCCYPVTYADITPDCGQGGSGGSVVTPPGVDVGETVGFASATGTAVSSSTGPCDTSCADALTNGGVPCPGPGSASFGALIFCACGGIDAGIQCDSVCQSFCSQQPSSTMDSSCAACLMSACPSQLANCVSN
jgi:hypothetical protein